VAGPLLGGLLTDTVGWHWIFFVNVPIGVLTWLVVGARLNLPLTRRDHHIDYLGALTLVAGVGALLLVTQWGGQEYAWGSTVILGLVAAAVLLLAAFLLVERRSPEPILPLRLFRNRTFALVNGACFVIALGMFGAIIYVPFYLQLVRGYSATGAGLMMIPVVGGILVTSISSGQAISRFGRWKPFPVAGAAVFTVGLALTATLTATTPAWLLAAYLAVIGAGLGLTMQTLVLAVQNDSDPAELGVATSSVAFSRSLGGAIGTAIFGAIVTAGTTFVPAGRPGGPPQLDLVAYTDAVARGFLVAVPLGVIAFVLIALLRATRLRSSSGLVAQAAQLEARREAAALEAATP
jgi:predicted MFS family arabinose efflux permease